MSSKVFSLKDKSLKLDTKADIEPHLEALRAIDDLEEIYLAGNTLGIEACKALGEVLAGKKTLRVANFADIFTGRLVGEIPEALNHLLDSVVNHPHLHTVDLSDNAFGLNTYAPLVKFLAAHVPLKHLYLLNNGLGPHCGILVANSLSDLHAKKEEARKTDDSVPHLETLICGRNRLENGSMVAWAKALTLHKNLRTVRMIQNGIRPEGIAHLLSQGLSHASDLQVLDLQDNTFSFLGAQALADAVTHWTGLVELGVSDCLLTDKGTRSLVESLAKVEHQKLEVIRSQYNDFTAPTLKMLAEAASKSLPALRRLEINGNKLSEENPSLVELQELFDERKEAASAQKEDEDGEEEGDDDDDDEYWGLDELDELDSDEEDEEEDEEARAGPTPEEIAEKLIKAAEEAQLESTAQIKDREVDDLAKELSKATI